MNPHMVRFEGFDTLFFRESRPHESVGGTELGSLFPPPARTVMGALRTLIGESIGADWTTFKEEPGYTINGICLREEIGFGDDLGKLQMQGPWLSQGKDNRLYPVPLYLLGKHDENKTLKLTRLHIGQPTRCDLGNVHLPELPEGHAGYKPLETAWLTRVGLEAVLKGGTPSVDDIREKKDLFIEEPRLGIARETNQRTVIEGNLYQTRHIRPRAEVGLEIDIEGLDERILLAAHGLIRLGGEGRLAAVSVQNGPAALPAAPDPNKDPDKKTHGLILTLLTPARFDEGQWCPPGLTRTEANGIALWYGMIHGVALALWAAVLGKAQREGGWDLAAHQPRAVQSLVPAGSSFYCTVAGDLGKAITHLHGRQIGHDKPIGRGLIACGLWHDQEYTGRRNV